MDEIEIDLSDLKYVPKEVEIKEKSQQNKNREKSKIPEYLKHRLGSERKIDQEVNVTKKQQVNDTKKQQTDDEKINKTRQILLIKMMINDFGEKLKQYKGVNFEKKTIDELISLKREMSFIVSSRSNLKQFEYLTSSGLQMYEYVCTNYTPLKVNGISNLLLNDQDFRDDIKLMCLNRLSLLETTPELRIGYKILSLSLLLHTSNTSNEITVSPENDNIKELNKEYSDI